MARLSFITSRCAGAQSRRQRRALGQLKSVYGDLMPRASFAREGGRCRDLEVANSAGGRDNRLVLTLCRQAGGEWKVEAQ